MVLDIQIEAKVVGSPKTSPGIWDVQLPVDSVPPLRCQLQEFIEMVVSEEVAAFQERQQDRRLDRVLSSNEIRAGKTRGKIDPAGKDFDQEVDLDAAVETAQQAFSDGLYYVFIDSQQIEDLESEIIVHPGSQVTFLRLVSLAGG